MAVERYKDVNSMKKQNKLVYESIIYPIIQREDDDIIITVGPSDRLDLLAHDYYGDSTLYWIIAKANNVITNDLFLEVGTQIYIPNRNRLGKILSDLRILNE